MTKSCLTIDCKRLATITVFIREALMKVGVIIGYVKKQKVTLVLTRFEQGDLKFADDVVSDRFKLWMDEVSQMFGGIDMFALDVMHTKDGKDVVLELNDSSMGLMYLHEKEDNLVIRDLVLQRMGETFYPADAQQQK